THRRHRAAAAVLATQAVGTTAFGQQDCCNTRFVGLCHRCRTHAGRNAAGHARFIRRRVATPVSVRTPRTGGHAVRSSIVGEQLDQSQLSTGHQSIQASQAQNRTFEACNICVCHGDLTGSEAGLYMPGLFGPGGLRLARCGFSAQPPTGPLGLGSINIFYVRRSVDYWAIDDALDYRPWPSTLFAPAFRSPPAQQQQFAVRRNQLRRRCSCRWRAAAAAAPQNCLIPLASRQPASRDCSQPQQQQQPFSLAEQANPAAPMELNWPAAHGCSDLVRLLKSLRPWFQDSLWGKALQGNYWVTGPMTWQEFHQRGMLIAPTAVRDWSASRLGALLAAPKKLQFVVLAPVQASRVLKKAVRRTMSELTVAFADCKLGEHSPVALSTDGDFFLDTGRLESQNCRLIAWFICWFVAQTEACQLRDTTVAGSAPRAICVLLALRVYTQVPKRVPYPTDGRSLCGFGPLKRSRELPARAGHDRPPGTRTLLEWICDLPEDQSSTLAACAQPAGPSRPRRTAMWADLLKRASLQQRGAAGSPLCAQSTPRSPSARPARPAQSGRSATRPPSVRRRSACQQRITHILGDPGVLGGDTGNDLFNDLDLNFDIQLPDIEEPVVGPQGGDGSATLRWPCASLVPVAPPEQAAVCLRATACTSTQLASCDRARRCRPLCDRLATHPLNTYKTTEVLRYACWRPATVSAGLALIRPLAIGSP
uniref:CRAL-TRIO domain-containing protein n=1 Tax=Macrostomum lignano TaxID=282301 RepID=A0A1I8FIC5_9PLAT